MCVMAEEDGLIAVILATSRTVCYANAEEKIILCVEKKDTAVLNTLQTLSKRNPRLGTAQS